MNFKSRLKSIERKLCLHIEGIVFDELLKPNYKHKGKPYDSYDEMVRELKVIERPPWLDHKDIIKIIENGLITHNSPEGEKLRKETCRQMQNKI
ncbi:MAG: hypothetical protein M3R36_03490 [Bacteroidota bacterium]|nr:hypothetical protein [Bacteroidota bacterium]